MTNAQIMDEVEAYIEQFEQIRQRVGDEQIAAVILEQIAKDARTARIGSMRNGNSSSNGATSASWNGWNVNAAGNGELATQRQLEYLRDLGVKAPKGLTKQEASNLIDEAVAR